MDLKPERNQRARVGSDPEERDVSERQLSREAEQQIEAHGCDDKDARRDQHVQHIKVVQPQWNRSQRSNKNKGKVTAHPIRSFCAKRPVGRIRRMKMISTKPMASR